jgi:hypothetical protein
MAIKEETLLVGLQVLPPPNGPLTKIKTVADLRQAVAFTIADPPSPDRSAQRDIGAAVASIGGGVHATSPSVSDPRPYWTDVWHTLFFSQERLDLMERDATVTVGEVGRLFDLLRAGFQLSPPYDLAFTDANGAHRKVQLSEIVGWVQRTGTRPIALRDAVQMRAGFKDFDTFERFFGPIPPGSDKNRAIKTKKHLLTSCIALQQAYWDGIK